MNRHDLALAAATNAQPLLILVENLYTAIIEAESESVDPAFDPAVMLIGAYVSFRTNADMATRGMYHRMSEICAARCTGGHLITGSVQ